MLMFVRYYHGLSLSVIGKCLGGHKTTVMRWMAPLAQVNWQGVVQRRQTLLFRHRLPSMRNGSGSEGNGGIYWSPSIMFRAFPCTPSGCPRMRATTVTLFLLQLKALGYQPKVIITDGWEAYVEAIARVFPRAQHLLCRFHALHARLWPTA